ncbi:MULTISPECIES: hypothetical protein [unclassified Microcoleus]|uniref:hypothetical protein n=1 Tax=unclassified Microcoleus TaxID=2642155 RepID=UPI002FD4F4B8
MSPPFGGATSAVIINSPGVVQAVRKRFIVICEGRRKKEEGRRKEERKKKEDGPSASLRVKRGKKEEGRWKREDGRRKREVWQRILQRI